MLEKLIKLANRLDEMGCSKEADYLDGVITEVHGKMPEITKKGP